jgi:hypothetical protein
MADGPESKQHDKARATDGGGDVVTFRCGEALVAVDAGDADTVRWLREFVTPWFAPASVGRANARVRLVANAARFAELDARQLAAGTHPVPCFSLDSALVSYPGWSEPDGATVVADGEYGCFYRVLGKEVEIVTKPGDPVARVGLLRVVREVATLRALAAPGMLDLHAAAFATRGCAVLLVGGKRAGKTTLLAHVLTSGQAALLANDRLLVDCNSLRATGVPTIVPVREDTERRFPALARGLPRRAALLHAGEIASPELAALCAGARLVLSPAQFARQLGAATAGSAKVSLIVFPEITADESMWSLSPVSREDGNARLVAGLYASRTGPRAPTIFQTAAGETPILGAQAALALQLASTVPLVICRLGPDAYRGHARAWLRALPLPKGEAGT